MSAQSPSDTAGYTLIEMLVVLLLLGFITMAVAGGLQLGTAVWRHSESTLSDLDSVQEAQTILRMGLSSAIPRLTGGFVTFDGEPSALSFDGPAPMAFNRGGLAHFELSLVPHDGATQLQLRVTALIDGRTTREAMLLDRLGDLQFSYLDGSEKVPVWLGYWRDRDRLPDAVRLSGPRNADARAWPDFVVKLLVAQDAACVFDPVSMICRRS